MLSAASTCPGEDFGPYTIYERLGIGGMATVHLAVHRATGTEVAIKRLLPQFATDKELIDQFILESNIGTALVHKNIVEVWDHGQINGVWYLVMERIKGQSLLSLLRRSHDEGRPPPIGVSLHILREVLISLDFAMTGCNAYGEAFHIVHRDLSPSNIIVSEEGRIKIIDFGVARSLEGRYATNSGHVKGKLGYMSPEVLGGRSFDGRSDLFSAGVVAWELLTAKRLYRGSDIEQLELRAQHYERTPPSTYNHWVSPELDQILSIALSEEPSHRWADARSMLHALEPQLRKYGSNASDGAIVMWLYHLDEESIETVESSEAVREMGAALIGKGEPANSILESVTTFIKIPEKKCFGAKVATVHGYRSGMKPASESGVVSDTLPLARGSQQFPVRRDTRRIQSTVASPEGVRPATLALNDDQTLEQELGEMGHTTARDRG